MCHIFDALLFPLNYLTISDTEPTYTLLREGLD